MQKNKIKTTYWTNYCSITVNRFNMV